MILVPEIWNNYDVVTKFKEFYLISQNLKNLTVSLIMMTKINFVKFKI